MCVCVAVCVCVCVCENIGPASDLCSATATVLNKTGNVIINITMRSVRVTTFAAEKQQVLQIVSVCL